MRTLPLLAISLALPARASLLMADIDAPGAFDAAVRVLAGDSRGTGIIYHAAAKDNLVYLCIATAAHVLQEGKFSSIGFRSESAGFNLTPDLTRMLIGGPTKMEDLGFLGLTIDLAKQKGLTDAQKNAVKNVAAVALGVAPDVPFDFVAHGYGATARPVTDPLEKATFNGAIYLYPIKGETVKGKVVDYGYGTERNYKSKMTKLDPFDKGGYKYTSALYHFENNGDGFGLGGDSGQGILHKGKAVGVYTSATTTFYDEAAMECNPKKQPGECAYEAIFKESPGRALAFNAADVKWLEDLCVPEPASWLLFAVGLMLVMVRFRQASLLLCVFARRRRLVPLR